MDAFQTDVAVLGGFVLASFVVIATLSMVRGCLAMFPLGVEAADARKTWARFGVGTRLCFGVFMVVAAIAFLLLVFQEKHDHPAILWYLGFELAWSAVTLLGIVLPVGGSIVARVAEFLALTGAAVAMLVVAVQTTSAYAWAVATQAFVFDWAIWSYHRFKT